MDQEEGHVTGPVALVPPHLQQQQQQQHYHQNQQLKQEYDYSDTAGDEDDDEDEDEKEEDNDDENTGDHQVKPEPHHPDEGSNEVADEEADGHDEDEGDDEDEDGDEGEEAVFPPPVIAEISEESQEYYMKPPEKVDDGPKPFRCDLCDKRFQEKSSVYRHIKEVHRKIIVLMGEDGRVAKVKSSPVHSCCGTTFTTRRALLRHQKSAACSSHHHNNNTSISLNVTARQLQLQQQKEISANKRKLVNGMTGSSKKNGTGARVTTASSEEDLFDEEASLGDHHDDDEDDDEVDEEMSGSMTEPSASSAMGMPYRCPYGICPQFFTTKEMMTNHLQAAHKMRMELVSVSAPSGVTSPMSLGATTKATGLTSTTISVTDKRFPCSVFGCQAAFTRKDRLNLHTRTHHSNSMNHSGFMSGLKVKLPSIQLQDHRIRTSSSSGGRSSSSVQLNGPLVTPRPPKETIHPKKHACDYPGCTKAYTKNSHVKRHKLSAHPDLFPQSNGRISDTPLLTTTSSPAQRRLPQHQINLLNPDDDEEEEDDEEEDGENGDDHHQDDGGSDDDNFEVFDDQDEEPVMRRGRNIVPRVAPTLKSSFLSLTTSNKSNGNRRKK